MFLPASTSDIMDTADSNFNAFTTVYLAFHKNFFVMLMVSVEYRLIYTNSV